MGVLQKLWDRVRGNTPPSTSEKREAVEVLTDEVSTHYRPSLPGLGFWNQSSSTPDLGRMLQDVEAMLAHPRVAISLSYYKSGIAELPVQVEDASSPEVAEFAIAELRRFWQRGRQAAQRSYEYGRGGSELVYTVEDGALKLDHVHAFLPLDTRVLTQEGDYRGIRVKGAQAPMDLWGPGAFPAKGFWHAHNRSYNRWYGKPILYPAWRPWRRLAGKDGAEDIVDGGVYRFAFAPPVGRYPPEDQMPNSKWAANGMVYTNRDKMRELLESLKAGGIVALSSRRDESGNFVWDVQWPEGSIDVSGLLEYTDNLEHAISLGIGVPPELLEASEVGSGYSGRAIPMESFLAGQQQNAEELVEAWHVQIGSPLIRWNFGPDAFCRLKVANLRDARMKAMQEMQKPPEEPGKPPGAPEPGKEDEEPEEEEEPTLADLLGDGKQRFGTEWDESKVNRDEVGRFAKSSIEKAEDELQERHSAKEEEIEKQQEAEDRQIEKQREREDRQIERQREREDAAYERQKDRERDKVFWRLDAIEERLLERATSEEHKKQIQENSWKEAERLGQKHLAEDETRINEVEALRQKEDEERQARRDQEDQERKLKREAEEKARLDAFTKELDELEARADEYEDDDDDEQNFSTSTYFATDSADWVAYTGPRGGKGFKNTKTGKIVYGSKKPGREDRKAEPEVKGKGKPAKEKPTKDKPKKEKPSLGMSDVGQKLADIVSGKLKTVQSAKELAEELMGLTVVQLDKLKAELKLPASGPKAEKAVKMATKALAAVGVTPKKEPAAKGKEEPKQEPKASDSMADHPWKDKSRAEIDQAIGGYNAKVQDPNPRKYDSKNYPPGVDGDAISEQVLDHVKQAQTKNSFMRPHIGDVYDEIRKDHPGLTMHQFHNVLFKMHAEGKIRLDPFTQRPVDVKRPEALMPMDRENKNYIDKPAAKGKEQSKEGKQAFRNSIKDAYEHMKLFKEFQDGVVEIPRLYHELKDRNPSMSLEDFHRELEAMSKEGEIELHKVNEKHAVKEHELGINKGEKLYYYVLWGKKS